MVIFELVKLNLV